MTAAPHRPPFADAEPAEIRAALIAGEQPEFDRQYQHALQVAADTLRLDQLHRTLEAWRRVAWMTTAHGAEAHRRMLRTAATRYTGEPIAADEPVDQVKARLGLQGFGDHSGPLSRPNTGSRPSFRTRPGNLKRH